MGIGNDVELVCVLSPGSDVNLRPVYTNIHQSRWSGEVIQLAPVSSITDFGLGLSSKVFCDSNLIKATLFQQAMGLP